MKYLKVVMVGGVIFLVGLGLLLFVVVEKELIELEIVMGMVGVGYRVKE